VDNQVADVVLVTLSDAPTSGCTGGCCADAGTPPDASIGSGHASASSGHAPHGPAHGPAHGSATTAPTGRLRAPVLACRDALTAAGALTSTMTACSDSEIDAILAAALDRGARLVVAAATDGQLRAVVRRLVRRYTPAPGQRPETLPADRTLPDLPAIGVLPLAPGDDLVARLGLPRDPAAVAAAVLGGQVRRLDLLRNDAGSVTLHGTLLGGVDDAGAAVPFAARVEVDDAVLADGSEPLIAAAVANADGYAIVDGLPLATRADPADGVLDVAVALPVTTRGPLGRSSVRMEVRRARGRAVSVAPAAEIQFTDDGVPGTLAGKRSWWMERAAWSVYAP